VTKNIWKTGEQSMKKIFKIVVIALFFILIIFISNLRVFSTNNSHSATKGFLDLTNWDFEDDGLINLGGEWECYDGQLLTPYDFHNNTKEKALKRIPWAFCR
jgi:hypothetical protein